MYFEQGKEYGFQQQTPPNTQNNQLPPIPRTVTYAQPINRKVFTASSNHADDPFQNMGMKGELYLGKPPLPRRANTQELDYYTPLFAATAPQRYVKQSPVHVHPSE